MNKEQGFVMSHLKLFSFLIFFSLVPWCSFAQSAPTPGETYNVLDFYYNGKGNGVVLVESKICRDVHKSGPSKYGCKNEVIEFGPLTADGTPPEILFRINKDETVYIWMSFLVPVGAEEKIYLRFNLDGETRRTSGLLSLKGSIRFRTWTNFTPKDYGDWEIEIIHENETDPILLKSFNLGVQ